MKFLPYILKTLWRHRSRTILTVIGSAIALFVFCFVGAVHEGMNDLQRRQEAKGSLIAFQANKFCPATSHLPQDYDQRIAELSESPVHRGNLRIPLLQNLVPLLQLC